MEAAPGDRPRAATLRTMPTHPNSDRAAQPSAHVNGLIHRLRRLVAEQRRLDKDDSDDRRDAYRREISRLKWRLANAVKRELSPGPGLRPALAFGR